MRSASVIAPPAGAASELDHLDLVRHAGDAAVPCGLLEGGVALVLAADASPELDPAFIDLHLDVFVRNLGVPDHALQDLAPKFVIGPSSGAEQVHLELVVDLVDTVGVARGGDCRTALGEALDSAPWQ